MVCYQKPHNFQLNVCIKKLCFRAEKSVSEREMRGKKEEKRATVQRVRERAKHKIQQVAH
jgi:hypothetical protein